MLRGLVWNPRIHRAPRSHADARHYPSGKDHYTVLPDVILGGVQFLWREEISRLPSSWPVREDGAK